MSTITKTALVNGTKPAGTFPPGLTSPELELARLATLSASEASDDDPARYAEVASAEPSGSGTLTTPSSGTVRLAGQTRFDLPATMSRRRSVSSRDDAEKQRIPNSDSLDPDGNLDSGEEGDTTDGSSTPTRRIKSLRDRDTLAVELQHARRAKRASGGRSRSNSDPMGFERVRGVGVVDGRPDPGTRGTSVRKPKPADREYLPAGETNQGAKRAPVEKPSRPRRDGGDEPSDDDDGNGGEPRIPASRKGKGREPKHPYGSSGDESPPNGPPSEPSDHGDWSTESESDGGKRKSKRRTNFPKVPEPAKYNAESDAPQQLKDWQNGMIAYLYAQSIDPDSLMAAPYILAMLKGKPYDHVARNVLPKVNKANRIGKGHRASPVSFQDICDDFRRLFVNPDYARIAEHRWSSLGPTRKDGTYHTVRELMTLMEEIADERMETTPNGMKIKFINSLHPVIAAKLNECCDIQSKKMTYLVERATKFEQTLLQTQALEKATAQGRSLSNYEALSTSGHQRLRKSGFPTPSGRFTQNTANQGVRNAPDGRRRRDDRDTSDPTPGNGGGQGPTPRNRATGSNATTQGSRFRKPEGQNDQHARSNAKSEKRAQDKEDGKCYSCGSLEHFSRDCPKKREHKTMEITEEEGAYPPPLVTPLTLNGVDGFEAQIDTGLSHSLMNPSIPIAMKLKLHQYITPRKMTLGTKGSRAVIKAYTFADVEIANVKKTMRFDIANIAADVIIGRNVMREHKLTLSFDPDEILARDPAGSPLKFAMRKRKRTFLMMDKLDEDGRNYTGPIIPCQLPIVENDEVLIPDVNDESTLPAFFSKLTDPAAEEDEDYNPSPEELQEFRDWIAVKFEAILIRKDAPLKLPPKREIEHTIKIIPGVERKASKAVYKVHDTAIPAYHELHDRHVKAGIWRPSKSPYTSPMMALLKKDGVTLRPTVDLRGRNTVVEQQIMPPMDMDEIMNALMANEFVTGADLHGAFQQLRTADEDVVNSAVASICGVFESLVAQQGDRNSTITLAYFIKLVFQGMIGRSIRAYADDIWVVSKTWKQHKLDVIKMLWRCLIFEFYITDTSLKICSNERDALGRKVAYGSMGIADTKKHEMLAFERPANKKDAMKFCGLVQYHEQFIEGLAEKMAPITYLCGEVPFKWTTTCELAFVAVKNAIAEDVKLTCIRDKDLAPKDSRPVHRESPPAKGEEVVNEVEGDYLFLKTDASLTGGASILGVGKNWWNAKPIRFQSRKWNSAQMNYPTHDQEFQALVDGVAKNESKLRGRKFYVCVDNKQVAQLLTSKKLNRRQHRMMEYLSEFDFEVLYVKGEHNVSADALSRQWEDGREATNPDPNDIYLPDIDGEFREFMTMSLEERQERQWANEDVEMDLSDDYVSNSSNEMPGLIPIDELADMPALEEMPKDLKGKSKQVSFEATDDDELESLVDIDSDEYDSDVPWYEKKSLIAEQKRRELQLKAYRGDPDWQARQMQAQHHHEAAAFEAAYDSDDEYGPDVPWEQGKTYLAVKKASEAQQARRRKDFAGTDEEFNASESHAQRQREQAKLDSLPEDSPWRFPDVPLSKTDTRWPQEIDADDKREQEERRQSRPTTSAEGLARFQADYDAIVSGLADVDSPPSDKDSPVVQPPRMNTRTAAQRRAPQPKDSTPVARGNVITVPEENTGYENLMTLGRTWHEQVMDHFFAHQTGCDTLESMREMCRRHHSFGHKFLYGFEDPKTGVKRPAATMEDINREWEDHRCTSRCIFTEEEAKRAIVPSMQRHIMSAEQAKLKIGMNEWYPHPKSDPARVETRDSASPLDAPQNDPSAQPQQRAASRATAKAKGAPAAAEKGKTSAQQRKLDQVLLDRQAEAWDLPTDAEIDLDEFYDLEFQQAIRLGYAKDTAFSKVVGDIDAYAYPQYKYELGMLWQNDDLWGPRLCIPKGYVRGRSLYEVILEHTHDSTGHGGVAKTLGALSAHWWWPSITKDTAKYVLSCPPCQATKTETAAPRGKLHSMPIPAKPYDEIAIDFQGPFPTSEWDDQPVDFLFNFLDCLSGEVIMIPCMQEGLTSEKCADIFLRNVYPSWGIPQVIRSDRDVRFTSEFWKCITRALGTTLAMSSAYHAATNGKIEQMHRVANQTFRVLVSEEQTDWAKYVPFVQSAINTSMSKSSGFAPFALTRVRMPTTIPSWAQAPGDTPAGAYIDSAKTRQSKARDALLRAQIEQTHFANKHRRVDADTSTGFDPASEERWAWLSTKNLSAVQHRSRKWVPAFVGPFKILHFNPRTSSYTLDLPLRYTRRNINNVFHSSLIKAYVATDDNVFPRRLSSPVPIFPLDSLEVTINEAIGHEWVAKDDRNKANKQGATQIDFHVELADKTLSHIRLPHPDVNDNTPWLLAYVAAQNERYKPTRPFRNWRDFSKPYKTAETAARKRFEQQNRELGIPSATSLEDRPAAIAKLHASEAQAITELSNRCDQTGVPAAAKAVLIQRLMADQERVHAAYAENNASGLTESIYEQTSRNVNARGSTRTTRGRNLSRRSSSRSLASESPAPEATPTPEPTGPRTEGQYLVVGGIYWRINSHGVPVRSESRNPPLLERHERSRSQDYRDPYYSDDERTSQRRRESEYRRDDKERESRDERRRELSPQRAALANKAADFSVSPRQQRYVPLPIPTIAEDTEMEDGEALTGSAVPTTSSDETPQPDATRDTSTPAGVQAGFYDESATLIVINKVLDERDATKLRAAQEIAGSAKDVEAAISDISTAAATAAAAVLAASD
ncbi:hypothetical protein P7C70_g5862, partial [Phenoliferia sp. Uapishka_3]